MGFLRSRKSSAQDAKERLQLVLVHDRTNLPPAALEALKDDLIAAISRYVEIEAQEVRIAIQQQGRSQRLVADIPLRASRGRRKD
uniref:Cell division topological specificity factor n=1 Tax=uncultured Chloroflexota bacterium TaxID=166587 RepID=H5SMY2_9CHLR|nr:cell division topological specificity factor MinE [uncultured Chloroflexota bacterium]